MLLKQLIKNDGLYDSDIKRLGAKGFQLKFKPSRLVRVFHAREEADLPELKIFLSGVILKYYLYIRTIIILLNIIFKLTISNYPEMSIINYNNKIFKPVSNTENGETSSETIFHYRQNENILTATYSGGKIRSGHLIGLIDKTGNIDMRYHQVNDNDELMTGICHSVPEILPNGKIRLLETWQWTSGDQSQGTSVIEEV